MRRVLTPVLFAGFVGFGSIAMAGPPLPGEVPALLDAKIAPKAPPSGTYTGGGRTGGDTMGDAVVIASFPFEDQGNTCGLANDYDEACPYDESTAPDAVYPLTITESLPCEVDCPAGAQQEGEPPCVDGYYDSYNGGCSSGNWIQFAPSDGDCGTICGRSCTYTYQGSSYRDTDWYWAQAAGGPVTMRCTAEFPLQMILIYSDPDCGNIQYLMATAPPCAEATLSWNFSAGQEMWLWIGPSVFLGVPESDYVLETCGITDFPYGACCWSPSRCIVISQHASESFGCTFLGDGTDCDPNPCGPTAVRETTWGRIKKTYR